MPIKEVTVDLRRYNAFYKYDPKAKAMYIMVGDASMLDIKTKPVKAEVNLDYDGKDNNLVGIEILLSRKLRRKKKRDDKRNTGK